MKRRRLALMGIGKARGEGRALEAAKLAISSPLLEASIDGARGMLLTIAGGSDLGLFEVNEAAEVITQAPTPTPTSSSAPSSTTRWATRSRSPSSPPASTPPGRELRGVDAAVTALPGRVLAVQSADCVPVLLAGPGAIGVAHAGRAGVLQGVIPAVVAALRQLAQPGPLRAVLGPAIGGCCYEVPAELRERGRGRPAGHRCGDHLGDALARSPARRARSARRGGGRGPRWGRTVHLR
jgi:hypothetical protein